MKNTMGLTWTFGLVIGFILIFVSFLILTLNYSNVFRIRNEILTILNKYEGYTDTSQNVINNYLLASGYKTKGKCPKGSYGVSDLNEKGKIVNDNKNYFYCINYEVENSLFEVSLFYNFNLPIIGNIMNFRIDGKTDSIKYAQMIS